MNKHNFSYNLQHEVVDHVPYNYGSIVVDRRLAKWIKEAKEHVGDLPPNTCPMIDLVLKKVERSSEFCKMAGRGSDIDDANNIANEAARSLQGIENEMEDIRSANETLRYLGVFWYERTKDLILEIAKLNAELEEAKVHDR